MGFFFYIKLSFWKFYYRFLLRIWILVKVNGLLNMLSWKWLIIFETWRVVSCLNECTFHVWISLFSFRSENINVNHQIKIAMFICWLSWCFFVSHFSHLWIEDVSVCSNSKAFLLVCRFVGICDSNFLEYIWIMTLYFQPKKNKKNAHWKSSVACYFASSLSDGK